MTIRPLDDRIVLRKLEPMDRSPLAIETGAVEPQNRGEVLAVGPGKRDKRGNRRPPAVNIGDVLFYGRFTDYEDAGELLVLIQEADVIGIESRA